MRFGWSNFTNSISFSSFLQFNFVGRILGPRGMTAKQLEQETGCKIMVRGKGSMRDKKKVSSERFPQSGFDDIFALKHQRRTPSENRIIAIRLFGSEHSPVRIRIYFCFIATAR